MLINAEVIPKGASGKNLGLLFTLYVTFAMVLDEN